jgi:hypothetical protein
MVGGDVVSPLLKGMFGLEKDARRKRSFAPHVPADWTNFRSTMCG